MMANLTLERRLVTRLAGPGAQAGYHTVIFRQEAGGRISHRILPAGEPYRPKLLERFGTYEAYAVSANPVLRHRLNEQLKTGVGGRRDVFSVHVTISYRVSQPGLLVERIEEDPLGLLEAEVKTLLRDWASTLSFDELADQRFDAEADFLDSRQGGSGGSGRNRLERLQDFAAVMGLEVDSLGLTREYSLEDWKVHQDVLDQERARLRNDATHATEFQKTVQTGEIKTLQTVTEVRVKAIEQGMRSLSAVVDRLDEALGNVARNTHTPRDLREAVQEVRAAGTEMSRLLSPQTALPEASNGGVLLAEVRPAESSGGPASPLGREVQRMEEVIQDLECTPAERAGLAGRILHVLAEACLSRESRNGHLEEHSDEVVRYLEEIGIEQAIRDPDQIAYLRRFYEPERLLEELGETLLGR